MSICFGRSQAKQMTMRITANPNAHPQTMTKSRAQFQKDPRKTVGVAFTRLDTLCDGQPDGQMGKNNISPDPTYIFHQFDEVYSIHKYVL